jgi:transcriptional regulator with XRE-family HTH domain
MAIKREASPTIRRRQLGVELRQLREASGLTGPQVASKMEWDPGKVYRLEGGRQGIKPKELRELLGYYGVTDESEVDTYVTMARHAKKPGWWSAYGPLPKTYETYIGIETSATAISCWEPILVNGLLQTEDYARAVIQGTIADMPSLEVERQLQLRAARQQRMGDVQFSLVLDEAVLHRVIGSRKVMRDQLSHLTAAMARPGVSIRVLPSVDGAHPGTRGAFTILEFEDGYAVYVETPAGELYPEGEHAETCRQDFRQLLDRALSPAETLALLEKTMDRY